MEIKIIRAHKGGRNRFSDVLGHAGVFVLAALVVLFWQGRRAGVLSALLRRRKASVSINPA
jgi:hypothetical protein